MRFEITRTGEPEVLPYGPFTDEAGTNHPAAVLDFWTDEELAAIGVTRLGPTLEALKADKLAAAEAVYVALLNAGFPIPGVPGETLQLRNETDRTNWLTLKDACSDAVALGVGDTPCALPIRTTANNSLPMTWAEAADLLRALRAWGAAMLGALWAVKDAINAAEDETALNAVDVEAGYPA